MKVRALYMGFLSLLLLLALPASAQALPRGLPDFVELVEKQGPAVVNISASLLGRQGRGGARSLGEEDDSMLDFLRRFVPPRQGGQAREPENRSLGSGFIVSSDGYILTNAHVVDAADEITVKLTDKREFRAKVIGSDKRTDVALVKVDARDLPVVKLGDPSLLRVGEWVLAIGSPFGFDSSVTAGIVSAKGRSLPDENYVPFIQTDVAINPGNSGGPLFNMRGEVVGVNSQIYSRTGGYMGLAFSIPIDVAIDVQNQLRATGKVSRGRIGVSIQELSRELADSFGLSKLGGALVSSVDPGGPADKVGIQSGDVILKFEGKPILVSGDLPRIVAASRPGSKVLLDVWRKGKSLAFTVTIAEVLEGKSGGQFPKRGKSHESPANRLGLVLSELSVEQSRALKLSGGLLISEVRSGVAGDVLHAGDVLLALTHKGTANDLRSVESLNKFLAQIDRAANLTFLVRRGDSQLFVTIKGVREDR